MRGRFSGGFSWAESVSAWVVNGSENALGDGGKNSSAISSVMEGEKKVDLFSRMCQMSMNEATVNKQEQVDTTCRWKGEK